jgi:hypothetical protein
MSLEKPPFCTQQYCSDAQQCVDAERCIGQGPFKDYPTRIEHPDGKTSFPQETPLWMENWLRGKYEQETAKQMGSGTQAQDAASPSGTRGRSGMETSETLASASDTASKVNQRNIVTSSTPIRSRR